LVDISVSTKKTHAHSPADNTPQTILLESPGGSGDTPAGALARTRHQVKNPLDDSTRIARGLGGSCQVHKPRVLHGPASQQKLGPADDVANDAQLLGQPKYLNDRPEGQSNLRPEGLAKEEWRPLLTPAHLSDRKVSLRRNNARFSTPARLWTAYPTERPGQTPLPTPTRVSDRGYTEPLLIALLRLAQSKPTENNQPGTPAR